MSDENTSTQGFDIWVLLICFQDQIYVLKGVAQGFERMNEYCNRAMARDTPT